MRDLLPEIDRWRERGEEVAVATAISAWGSSPRPVGAKMAVAASGAMAGSVSGGCVEGAVCEEARSVLAGAGPRRVRYGVDDETAWSVGLSCGGAIEIWIERLAPEGDAVLERLRRALARRELLAVATLLDGDGAGSRLAMAAGGDTTGGLGSAELDRRVAELAPEVFRSFSPLRREVEVAGGPRELFVDVYPPPPRLLIVGAVHVAVHLIPMARRLGFRTLVVDPRTAFATPERFHEADELHAEWPQTVLPALGLDASTYVAVLSHDLKIDVPALAAALDSPARYIGALGSRKTHSKRIAALQEAGVPLEKIDRIRSPIGFDLGGRRAEEIALAVLAELVAARHGRLPA